MYRWTTITNSLWPLPLYSSRDAAENPELIINDDDSAAPCTVGVALPRKAIQTSRRTFSAKLTPASAFGDVEHRVERREAIGFSALEIRRNRSRRPIRFVACSRLGFTRPDGRRPATDVVVGRVCWAHCARHSPPVGFRPIAPLAPNDGPRPIRTLLPFW